MSGLKMFTIGISIFLFVSLGSLMVIAALSPKPPELTQEEKDALVAAKLATNELMDSFVASKSIENNIIGTPELHITVKNTSDKAIDGIEIWASFYNNFDEPAGEWGDSSDNTLLVRSQQVIEAGDSKTLYWNLAAYESATRVTNVRVYRVHYSDGTTMERYFPPSE